MTADTISPEERLFKAIQRGKQLELKNAGKRKGKIPGWIGRFKNSVAPLSGKGTFLARLEWLKIETINGFLAVFLGIVLLAVGYMVLGRQKDISKIVDAAASGVQAAPEVKIVEPFQDLKQYVGEVSKRDIFHPPSVPSTDSAARKPEYSAVKSVENLNLQGISWGDVPKTMILYTDGDQNNMYFLVEGQSIGTSGYKVTKISKTSVTVNDGTQEKVLLL